MHISRGKIIKDSVQYLSATVIAQGVGLFRGVMMPIIFNPAQLGLWSLANVVVGYGANASFGLLHGMNKAIPLFRGQNDDVKIESMKNSVFWMNMIIGIIVILVMFMVSFTNITVFHTETRLIALIVFLQLMFLYIFSLLRANGRFGLLSQGLIYHSILMTGLTLAFAVLFKNRIVGALIGFAGAFLVTSTYWFIKGGYSFPPMLNKEELRKAFVLGFPLIILGVLDSVFVSIDRWLIATQLNVVEVGYYALGIMVNGILCLIPGSVASTLYPRMLERFSVAQDPVAGSSLLLNPLRALAALMLVLICVSVVALPLFIQFFLPKYVPSIPVVKVFVLGVYLFSLSVVAGTYMVSINKQARLMHAQIFAIIIVLVVNMLLLKAGFGLFGVAIGTVVGYALYGTLYVFMAVRNAVGSSRLAVHFLVSLLIPYVALIGSFAFAHAVLKTSHETATLLITESIRLLIILSLLTPALFFVNKDGELLNIFRLEVTRFVANRKT